MIKVTIDVPGAFGAVQGFVVRRAHHVLSLSKDAFKVQSWDVKR
jgi:hypothetical protein